MNAKRIAALSFAALLSFSAASCSESGGTSEDYGTLSVADITLTVGESAEIQPVFSEAGEWTVEYTFSGDAIDISEGRVYALAANQTVTVTAYTPRHETQFTVTTLQKPLFAIADFTAWVDGPAVDFAPAWIDPAYDASQIEYDYAEELLLIDAEEGTATGRAEGPVFVTASLDGYTTEFVVQCEILDYDAPLFDTTPYDAAADRYAAEWTEYGTARTTAFIGDSFFDSPYWTGFYETYAGKDVRRMGISATTSLVWEQYVTRMFGGKAPANFVIHLGTNNIYGGRDAAQTSADMKRFFRILHAAFPDSGIWFFGISLRAYDEEKTEITRQVNADLSAWCERQGWLTYIDTPTRLTSDMLLDGTHPKPEAYSVFVDALAETDIEIADL